MRLRRSRVASAVALACTLAVGTAARAQQGGATRTTAAPAATAAPAGGPARAGNAVAGAREAAAAVDALAEEAWQRQLRASPPLRLERGLPVDTLPDLSFEHAAAEAAWAQDALGRLASVDLDVLDPSRRLTARLLDHQLRLLVDALPSFWHRFQVTPYTWSFSGVQQAFAGHPLATADDRRRFLALLDQLPRVAAQLRGNLGEQRRRGILLPQPAIDLVAGLFGALAAHPAASPFRPAAARLEPLAAGEAAAFLAEVDRRLEADVSPAFAGLVRAWNPETTGPGGAGGRGEYAWAH